MHNKILKILAWFLVAIGIIAVFVISKSVGKAVATNNINESREEALVKGLNEAAIKVNKECPKMLDKETRLDRVEVGTGMMGIYHHTLVNYNKQEIDKERLDNILKPKLIENVCNNQEMQPSLRYGVTYVYAYKSKDNMEIVRYEISKKDCGF